MITKDIHCLLITQYLYKYLEESNGELY